MSDLNYIAKLEKIISEKYGEKATLNPRSFWNEEKEQEYLKLSKENLIKEEKNSKTKEKIELQGILINKNLLKNKLNKTCDACKKYSFIAKDDVYLLKYNSCYDCYIKYIEDRENRWLSGWRPTER